MIDKDKQYRTRDGREVRIYATDCGGDYPVHGAVKSRYGDWFVECWTQSGAADLHGGSDFDLVEVKPRIKRTVWLTLRGETTALYLVRPSHLGSSCLAVVEVNIDCEHGEGLNND